ncbi:MAG TPA: hypothetical protein VHE35_23385 [Kofleriaceae bacterium]|nr:hypothetical protein [Kofleriaceae bacterium]
MKRHLASIIPALVLAGCGGSKPKPATPAPVDPMPATTPAVEETEPAPAPDPEPPPPPQQWQASAELVPIKGVKMPSFQIAFVQTEGESTHVRSAAAIEKLKKGSYHLVVHQGTDCGAKAAKAGVAMVDLTESNLLVATKTDMPSVDLENGATPLDGEGSIVGHALVLHADKHGKIGSAVACGIISPE